MGMCGLEGIVVQMADELSNAISQHSIPVAVPTQLAAGITPIPTLHPISTHSPAASLLWSV